MVEKIFKWCLEGKGGLQCINNMKFIETITSFLIGRVGWNLEAGLGNSWNSYSFFKTVCHNLDCVNCLNCVSHNSQ